MKLFQFSALIFAMFAFPIPAIAATCAPATMVKIVLTNVTPGIQQGSFASQPRTYYRIGNDKMRTEEAADEANAIHGLIVVAEPNIWMINLFDNTGRHIVDPGPSFNAIAPVIALDSVPSKLAELQLGCEADYIAANAITPARNERIGNADFTVYRIAEANDAIELLERRGTTSPAYARYYREGKLDFAVRYDAYETGLPYDPSLFVPPKGVRLTENAGQ